MSEEIKNQEAAEAANQDELDQIVSLKKGDTVKGTIVKLEDNQAVVALDINTMELFQFASCLLVWITQKKQYK